MNKRLLLIAAFSALFMSTTTAQAGQSVTVFAASSLQQSFTTLGKQFENSHRGVKVNFSFLASSTLAAQIKAGAPADIFVAASPEDMKGIAEGENYLANRVVLAVPTDSKINQILDLNGNYRWIRCAPEVPCGMAAGDALVGEGVTTSPVSLEPKVTSAVAKLISGEVDAAIVYRTDVLANKKKLRAIEFANRRAATTTYQIALLRKNRWASTFLDYLNSRAALKLLSSKGFEIK